MSATFIGSSYMQAYHLFPPILFITHTQDELLLQFLHISARVLQHYLTADWTLLSKDDHALLSGFLNVTSHVLNWDFQHHLDNMFMRHALVTARKAEGVVLKPPRSYASTFLDPNFLVLFLKLLSKVHDNEDQTHHVIQCLTQLASLTKPVFETDVERQTYLVNFVSGILEYVSARYITVHVRGTILQYLSNSGLCIHVSSFSLPCLVLLTTIPSLSPSLPCPCMMNQFHIHTYSSATMSQQEVYGLSCILRRLATTFSTKQFSELGIERLEVLVRLLYQLTCLCAQKTVHEEV